MYVPMHVCIPAYMRVYFVLICMYMNETCAYVHMRAYVLYTYVCMYVCKLAHAGITKI
jgi:hypothetical protein